MCSSCGTGRPTGPWEDSLGSDRGHRVLRARALTAAAGTSALRFTADPATRAYHVHRATAPQQVAYDVAQCLTYLSVPVPKDCSNINDTGTANALAPLACPLDVWVVVLQLHAKVDGPHLVRVADATGATTVHLHGDATSATPPFATPDGPFLNVTGPHADALRESLYRTASALCHRLYLTFPTSA